MVLLLWQLQLSLTQAVGYIIQGGCVLITNLIILVIRVRFTQNRFTGLEATGFVLVNLELTGGTSASSFNVTVTPSEQSPVSAEGNSVYYNVLTEECLTNRW